MCAPTAPLLPLCHVIDNVELLWEIGGLSLLDMGKFAQGCGQTVCVAELEPGSEAAALAPPPRRLRSVGSAGGGAVSASLLAPADGKGAAQGGRWTFRINYGGGGGSGVRLVAPSDGKGAAEGGRWTVNIGSMLGGGGGGGAAAKGDEVRAPAPAGGGKLNCGACQSWWDVRHPTASESMPCRRETVLAMLTTTMLDARALHRARMFQSRWLSSGWRSLACPPTPPKLLPKPRRS